MKKHLIYGLYCPFTNELHYIGKSSVGMTRPLEHLTKSHSEKINEWVQHLKFLNYQPVVRILEECTEDNLDDKEKKWINESKENGSYLLNVAHNSVGVITRKYEGDKSSILAIATTVKKARKEAGIKQEDLAKMGNISRTTLSSIENGDEKIVYSNLRIILGLLGYEIKIEKIK